MGGNARGYENGGLKPTLRCCGFDFPDSRPRGNDGGEVFVFPMNTHSRGNEGCRIK